MAAEYHFSLHHHFVSFPIFLIITKSFYIKLPQAKEKLLLNICICDENIKVRIYFQAKGDSVGLELYWKGPGMATRKIIPKSAYRMP